MRTQKNKISKKQIAIFVSALAGILLVTVYLILGFYFKNHFHFRTTINGLSCSGKSISDVEILISETIAPYRLELKDRDGQIEIIKGTDIDLRPDFDGSLQNELKSRNSFAWPLSLFRKTTIESETMVTYDEEKLRNIAEALSCVKQSDDRKPVNARISDYIDGKGYEIIPEEIGAQINETALLETLHSSITNLLESLSLDEANCYVEPAITSDDETLKAACKQMNASITATITYEFGADKETLDGSAIRNWLSLTEDNQVVIDEAQAADYVKSLASKYDTYGKTRSFTTTYGPTVQLSNNKYGWQIDREKETAQLLEDIKNGTVTSREPAYSHKGKNRGSRDYGDTYVEINLTAQHLYMYKNGSLILESDLISGNVETKHATPPGAFSVTYTQKGAVLRGRDYASPVDFWMPFNGNIGMHDASWKSDFGGNYYLYTGSHGCINLPRSSAETIFNNIKAGDPVFVYKLEGTESDKFWKQTAADVVTHQILDIGSPITLDSKSRIDSARVAYNALSDEEKQYVRTYDFLLNAEAEYAKLLEQ